MYLLCNFYGWFIFSCAHGLSLCFENIVTASLRESADSFTSCGLSMAAVTVALTCEKKTTKIRTNLQRMIMVESPLIHCFCRLKLLSFPIDSLLLSKLHCKRILHCNFQRTAETTTLRCDQFFNHVAIFDVSGTSSGSESDLRFSCYND